MTQLMDVLAQGLSGGAVLLLTSLGLTVIYGVMGVVNLAHGELVMLGAYVSVLSAPVLGAWPAMMAAPLVVAAVGLTLDRAVVRWLYRNPVRSMLGTFAVGLVIRQLVVVIEGPQLQYSAVPLSGALPLGFGTSVPLWRVVVLGVALVAAISVGLWLARTRTGLAARITAADHEVAQTLGLNVNRVSAATFAIGAGLAGLTGALVAPLASVSPDMGGQYLVGAFLVVVLAGLGNVKAAAVWAGAVGVVTAAIAIPFDDVVAQVAVWTAALLLVAVRTRRGARV